MTVRTALAPVLLALVASACQPAAPLSQPSPTPAPTTVAATPAATAPPSGPRSAAIATARPDPTPTPSPSPMPQPRTAACGQAITSDFVLANDLTCSGDALVVAADGITLDLNGKLLKGPGMGPQTWPSPQLDSVAVRVEGRRNVTVRNGRIAEFSTGVYFVRVTGSLIENVVSQRSRFGLYVHDSDGNTVRRNVVEANIYGLHLQNANDTLVQGNELVRQTYNSPGGYGIYLFASQRNRIVENRIEDNINWGIWFSEARGNLIYHNTVAGNRPQVSDSNEANQWYDPRTKQGNFWGDYRGRDGDGDGIGDTPYPILGAGGVVDAYPFVEMDGWKKKAVPTIDHYQPPLAKPRRDVRIVALTTAGLVAASPGDDRASALPVRASSIALANDRRTVYALDGGALVAVDVVSGRVGEPIALQVEATVIAANRDGRSAFVIGPTGAEQIDLTERTRLRFGYEGRPSAIAASYKHDQMFVATHDGIDLVYLGTSGHHGRGGQVAYTIPLGAPPGAMTMNGSGTRIYAAARGTGVVDVVDTEQLVVVDRIRLGVEATALAVDARESRLYAGTADGAVLLDLLSKEILRRVPLPGRAMDIAVSPNADEIYVALGGARLGVAVLSAADLAIERVIDLDAAPARILVATY